MSNVIKPNQRENLANKTPQEAFEILKGEGVELTDEQLATVAGGIEWDDLGKDVGYVKCPKCGQVNLVVYPNTSITCSRCGNTFTADW